MVAWNVHATGGFRYFNPPTGQNWLIGATGDRSPAAENLGTPAGLEELPYLDDRDQTEMTDTNTGSLISSLDTTLRRSLYRTSAHEYAESSAEDPFDAVDGDLGRSRVRQYFVGDPDDFTLESNDVVNDSVYANPAFVQWIGTTAAVNSFAGFDYVSSSSKSIPFSIRYELADMNLPWGAEYVDHAYLAVRLKRVGSWTQDSDHLVQIAGAGTTPTSFTGFTNDQTANARTFYWRCTTSTVPGCNPGNQTAAPFIQELAGPHGWGTQNWTEVRIIELPSSLFGGILNRTVPETVNGVTRRFAELNVNFSRRTRVDWACLTLVVKRHYNVP
jgi:hypothetical protein